MGKNKKIKRQSHRNAYAEKQGKRVFIAICAALVLLAGLIMTGVFLTA